MTTPSRPGIQTATASSLFWNRSHPVVEGNWDGELVPYPVPEPAITVSQEERFAIETTNTCHLDIRKEADIKGSNGPMAGNPWTGPVFVEGVRAGEVIAVDIHQLEVTGHSFIGGGGSVVPEYLQVPMRKSFIPIEAGFAVFPAGFRVPVRPMYGCFGVVPVGSRPEPWDHGGNMDIPEVCAGSTIHVRCERDGAYFGCGDGHALQGEGEVTGWSFEVALRGELTVKKSPYQHLKSMLIETEHHAISVGIRHTIRESTKLALWAMADHVSEVCHVSPIEAYEIAAYVGNIRVGAMWPLLYENMKIPVPICVHLQKDYFSR